MTHQSLEDKLRAAGDPITMLRTENYRYTNPNIPPEYTNWIEEQRAWAETCYVYDMSHHMLDLHLEGPDAIELLSDLSVNSFEGFEVGQAKHAVQCNVDGNVVSQGLLRRLGQNEFQISGNPQPSHWLQFNAETGEYEVETEVLNHEDRMIHQLQGPNSLRILDEITEENLREIGFMNFEEVTVAGNRVHALRHGMAGEAGFELHGRGEYGAEIWERLVEAGEPHGLRKLGWKAYLTTRIVSGLAQGTEYIPAIYGDEMADYREWLAADSYEATSAIAGSYQPDDISAYYRSPVDLGWESYISFDHSFLGDDALEQEVEHPERELVTLVWDDTDVVDVYASLFDEGATAKYLELPGSLYPRVHADAVVAGGEQVGLSFGPGYIYNARAVLSLCTIDSEHSDPGTEVTIRWGEGGAPSNPPIERHEQTPVSAEVTTAPYKEDRRKSDFAAL